MARGDKDYSKVSHNLKGKSAAEKKKALHKMVEALIAEKTEEAQVHLHQYLKLKTREILMGESEDEVEKEEGKEEEKKDHEDKEMDDEVEHEKEEDKEEDKKVEEGFAEFGHGEGAMSRKVHGNSLKGPGKKAGALKHGNAAPELDDKIKGDVKFANNGKKSGALKHGNNAPGLEDAPKGNVFKK